MKNKISSNYVIRPCFGHIYLSIAVINIFDQKKRASFSTIFIICFFMHVHIYGLLMDY
jgi:hypothetical protein